MTTQEIVSKLWNLCNVLRDDGITYHQYVTELTYILFLKMAKETVSYAQRNFTKLVKFGSYADVNFLLRLACNENAVYRGHQKLC